MTGEEGKDVPTHVSLYLRWFEHRGTHDLGTKSTNLCRKQKRAIVSDCLEPRASLGFRSKEAQRSEISRENVARSNTNDIISPTVTADENTSTRVT